MVVIPYTSKNYKVFIEFYDFVMYDESNYGLVYNGIENKTFVKDGDSVEVPESYYNKQRFTPNEIFGKFVVGSNVDYNIKWLSKAAPKSVYEYYLNDAALQSKMYIPPTIYTGTKLDLVTEGNRSAAETALIKTLQDLVTQEFNKAAFDTAYDAMLVKFESDKGLEAYGEYTKIYKTLTL
jgi:hypothetical protein